MLYSHFIAFQWEKLRFQHAKMALSAYSIPILLYQYKALCFGSDKKVRNQFIRKSVFSSLNPRYWNEIYNHLSEIWWKQATLAKKLFQTFEYLLLHQWNQWDFTFQCTWNMVKLKRNRNYFKSCTFHQKQLNSTLIRWDLFRYFNSESIFWSFVLLEQLNFIPLWIQIDGVRTVFQMIEMWDQNDKKKKRNLCLDWRTKSFEVPLKVLYRVPFAWLKFGHYVYKSQITIWDFWMNLWFTHRKWTVRSIV